MSKLVDTNKLRGVIAERGESQQKVANYLGISKNTFYRKMKKGVFDTNEIEKMVTYLAIKDPMDIFFAKFGA